MHAKIMIGILAFLLVPGASCFAQFKNPAKAAKNLANLDRVIARAAKRVTWGRPVVRVPGGVVSGNAVGLLRVKTPKRATPVTKSYDTLLSNGAAGEGMFAKYGIVNDFSQLVADEWVSFTKRAFYTDQNDLARDLNEFYEGKADVFTGPDGHPVKFYALPVDGILYQPAGYQTPVVLNHRDYFVIYDVQTNTGKLADNTPGVYRLFKPELDEEIWQAMGNGKVFDDLNNLCDAILMAHLHKARLEALRTDEVTASSAKAWVRRQKAAVFKQLNDSEQLLSFLKQLPQVRQTDTKFMAYVVELPVDGLTWVKQNGAKHVYHPQEHVMLFFELGAVGIFPRADVENPALFEHLAHAPARTATVQKHPKNALWAFYEAEKIAWSQDRKGELFERIWEITYPRHFTSQSELGIVLASFHHFNMPRIEHKATHQISYVYELPVKGITVGNEPALDPEEYVFLYNTQTVGEVVKRSEVENAALYEFVK